MPNAAFHKFGSEPKKRLAPLRGGAPPCGLKGKEVHLGELVFSPSLGVWIGDDRLDAHALKQRDLLQLEVALVRVTDSMVCLSLTVPSDSFMRASAASRRSVRASVSPSSPGLTPASPLAPGSSPTPCAPLCTTPLSPGSLRT